VVDKHKSVVKLWATVFVVHGFSTRPEGLGLVRRNRPQVHRLGRYRG